MIYVWDLHEKEKKKVFACTKRQDLKRLYDYYPEFQPIIYDCIKFS